MAKNMEIALLFDFYGEMLPNVQRDMIEFYYEDDLSLSEIAENRGISRQGVRDSIKRAEMQLLEMEDRLGLAKQFREIQDAAAAIRAAANEIAAYNDRFNFSREIDERARRIMSLAEQLAKN